MKKCKNCGSEITRQTTTDFCSQKCYTANHYLINRCERRKIEDLPGEIWKEVDDYLVTYGVSNLGRIKSISRFIIDFNNDSYIEHERLLKCHLNTGGYYTVTTKKGDKIARTRLHRMIAKAFIPNPDNKPCINHKDLNRTNNSIDNLEWVTYSENIKHGYDNNPNRKRSWKQIIIN
mgnify:FL=1